MLFEEAYFWENTLKDWKLLLRSDKYKELIIGIRKALLYKKLIPVYGFVIIPNYLHVVWEIG